MDLNLDYRGNKGFRLLSIYERLNKGELLSKEKMAVEFGVSDKTIQRDIDDLRAYLVETYYSESEVVITYDKKRKGYYLVRYEREWLTNEEVLAVSKIVLESRAFEVSELKSLIRKLLGQVVPHDRKFVEKILGNEYKSYVPLKHGQKLLSPIWELSNYISKNELITFDYIRQDHKARNHKVQPVEIMF